MDVFIMPNNYVGNTGDTNENHLVVGYRAQIDDHVVQLSSVKGFAYDTRHISRSNHVVSNTLLDFT